MSHLSESLVALPESVESTHQPVLLQSGRQTAQSLYLSIQQITDKFGVDNCPFNAENQPQFQDFTIRTGHISQIFDISQNAEKGKTKQYLPIFMKSLLLVLSQIGLAVSLVELVTRPNTVS